MRKNLFLVVALISATLFSSPTTLFNDSFDSDDGAWAPLLQSVFTVANGQLELNSTNKTGQSWVVRTATQSTNFLFEANTVFLSADTNARIGLTFRTQDNMEAYHLYVYPSGSYIVYRYTNGSWADFSNHYLINHSFIRSDTNKLSVWAHDSVFEFFCNGHLLTTIKDTSSYAINTAGLFGLVASGKCRAAVTEVTASVEDFKFWPRTFSDNFSGSQLIGWKNYGGIGTFNVTGGKLQATSPANTSIASIFSDGSYGTTDTIEVVATPQAPLPTGNYNYGLIFHYDPVLKSTGALTTRAYHFCIVKGTHYTVLKQDSSGVDTIFAPVASLSIQSNGTNRLKVINRADGLKELYINGNKVKEFTDNSFASGGVGLMLNGGVSVNFDDFEVRGPMVQSLATERTAVRQNGSLQITAFPNPLNPVTAISVSGITGTYKIVINDASGRTVATLNGRDNRKIEWNATNYSAGIYFATIYAGSARNITKRLLLLK